MACPPTLPCGSCQECEDCVEPTTCAEITYTDDGCPEVIDFKCVTYQGDALSCLGVIKDDTGEDILSKVNDLLCDVNSPIAMSNTDHSLAITLLGPLNHTIVINTSLSIASGNILSKNSDGLYASFTETTLVATDTSTIDFTTGGTHGHSLTASVKVSATTHNLITINSDGLYVGLVGTGFVKSTGGTISYIIGTSSEFIKADGSLDTSTYLTSYTEVDTLESVTARGNTSSYNITALSFIKSGGTSGQFLKANGTVDNNVYLTAAGAVTSITGTANQVIASASVGAITLSLPQSIATTSNVTFAHVIGTEFIKIGGLSTEFLKADGSVDSNTYLTSQTSITGTDSSSIDFTISGTNNHTVTAVVKISATGGNGLSINSDGLYAATYSYSGTTSQYIRGDGSLATFPVNVSTFTNDSGYVTSSSVSTFTNKSGNISQWTNDSGYITSTGISGTLNYISKFTSSSTIGNSLVYDNGVGVVIGSTTPSSLFTVVGTASVSYTNTYSSGTSYAFGAVNNVTYTGTLPSSNTSFSAIPLEFRPILNGNTIVGGDTPFGAILANNMTSFSNAGTLTMSNGTGGGLKASSAVIAGIYDLGSINGTITKSAGILINGIFLVAGSTGVITRTNHYQLLINDTNEFSHGGNITNKWGIYQIGTSDVNFLAGELTLGAGQVVSSSSTNSVTNKVKLVIAGTTYYLLASTSGT